MPTTRFLRNGWTQPNEYRGSTLHQAMEATPLGISQKERELIIPRTLTASDGEISGDDVENRLLWPLSYTEHSTVSASMRIGYCWLRTPCTRYVEEGIYVYAGSSTGNNTYNGQLFSFNSVRPAFQLNLDAVLFTSDAAGGKSAIVGDRVEIAYTGAAIGAGRSVSVVIADGPGIPLLYGRPVDTSSINGSDTVSFDLPSAAELTDGTYKLLVFHEEVNGDNQTDLASTPREISLTISNARLAVTPPRFSPVTLGYSRPAVEPIALNGAGATAFVLADTSGSADTVPAHDGTNTTWTVQPQADLPVGNYTSGSTNAWDNDTHNPNTGDGGGIWAASLLGSLSAVVLSLHRGFRKQAVKH